jgi:ribosomal protein L37AE/L43A
MVVIYVNYVLSIEENYYMSERNRCPNCGAKMSLKKSFGIDKLYICRKCGIVSRGEFDGKD